MESSLESAGGRPRALLNWVSWIHSTGRKRWDDGIRESLANILARNHTLFLLGKVFVRRGEEMEHFFYFGLLGAADGVLFGELGLARFLGRVRCVAAAGGRGASLGWLFLELVGLTDDAMIGVLTMACIEEGDAGGLLDGDGVDGWSRDREIKRLIRIGDTAFLSCQRLSPPPVNRAESLPLCPCVFC